MDPSSSTIIPSSKDDFMKEVNQDFQDFSLTAQSIEEKKDDDDRPQTTENNNEVDVHDTNDSEKKDSTNLGQNQENDNPLEKNARYVAPKDFELLKVIGLGAFGKVLQVKNKQSDKIYAMKVISKRLLRKKVSYVQNVQAERDILTKIRHPFIVSMHCSFQTKQKLFIIMDFCSGGELFLRLGREGVFLERTAAFYLAEIILALDHLHGRGILHRDLKPENILLHSDGHLALTDFGLAKDFSSNTFESSSSPLEQSRVRTICGTVEYMAPEMIARKGYGKAADFWSLGCIAYEMMSGNPPFESKKGTKDLFRKILNERVRMPDGSSAEACRLLKGLLNRDASKRLGSSKGTMFVVGGITELKQSDFFNGLDWRLLELKEIDPPETYVSENSDDLHHFHDEFLKMDLPRSVKEMSKTDFKPQRCVSNTFRGFSFIQEDFALPERPDNELEHYWNNVDTDGYSVSDCSSSVFDDEDVPAIPEKKKRPPRKKKKKKDAMVFNQLEPCPEQDQKDDTDNKDNNAISEPIVSTHASLKIEDVVPANKPDTEPVMSTKKDAEVEKAKIPPKTKPAQPKWEAVLKNSVPPVSKTTSVHTARYSLSSRPCDVGTTRKEIIQSKLPVPKKTVSDQPAYKPQPGSWAARAITSKQGSATTSSQTASRSGTSINIKRSRKDLPQSSSFVGNKQYKPPSVDERPALAVQEAFWPSIIGTDSKSSQTKGASEKSDVLKGAWSKKSTRPSAPLGAWKT